LAQADSPRKKPRPDTMYWHLLWSWLLALAAAAETKKGSKACAHTGFFSKSVVPLCERHFPEESSKHAWVVQFYHSRVGYVVDARATYEALARDAGRLNVKVGAVDCEHNMDFCQKYGIREAPTTRFVLGGRSSDYAGNHTELDTLQHFVTESRKKFKEMEEALKCDAKGLFTDIKKDVALPLCTRRFPPALDPVPWLISFYETVDRNKDKTMRSILNKLADKYGNVPPGKPDVKNKKPLKLRVGAVDCGHSENDCGQLGVTTLPTVRLYRSGAEPVDFESFFDRDELQQWANARLKEMPKPEKVEALKADMPEDTVPTKPKEDL